MSGLNRVVFFSKQDLAGPNMLEKAEMLLKASNVIVETDVNSLLEYHHINKYFENNMFLTRWNPNEINNYKNIVKDALVNTKSYFNQLSNSELLGVIESLEFSNREIFWELFRLFEKYKKIERETFKTVLSTYPDHIAYILKFKQIVEYYKIEVRNFLLTYSESAELLLSHFEEKRLSNQGDFFFPNNLTDSDKHLIITNYIDSPEPNLNYLNLIRSSRNLKLPPKILLKAKQRIGLLLDKYFTDENSTKISVEAGLDMKQKEPVIFNNNGENTNAIYGGLYMDSLESDLEVMNLFHHLFEYTDNEGLITLINKDSDKDSIEKALMHSKNAYQAGIVFSHKNLLSLSQLGIMCIYLKRKGKSIENIIQCFVDDFFANTLIVKGYFFNTPRSDSATSDKIRLLAPEIEYLLKQYKNFVSDGQIDHELLQIDSSPVFFSEIPSLVNLKYVYSTHEKIQKIQYYFFETTGILKSRNNSNQAKNVFQLLYTENIKQSELEGYQLYFLNHVIQEGFISLDQNGVFKIVDPMLVFIAGRLREYGSLSYWHYPLSIRTKIDQLITDGILTGDNHLLTKAEVSYLNYYLNKKEFSNGLDLRNKYLHGSNNRSIEVQELDYLYFLRTLILILLKLKDDANVKAKCLNK